METWDALTSRRNVRQFSDEPIADTDLDAILEASRRSPSSKNWQPWDFVVVTDPTTLNEMAGDWTGTGHVAGAKAAHDQGDGAARERDGEHRREGAGADVLAGNLRKAAHVPEHGGRQGEQQRAPGRVVELHAACYLTMPTAFIVAPRSLVLFSMKLANSAGGR